MRRRPLDLESLQAGLAPPWRYLEVVAETGSTNADLLARAKSGENIDGAVLIAEHQTAGKGRLDRTWSAVPCAQITLSVGVGASDVATTNWGWLPLAAGLAVIDAVAHVTGITAGLKWPNDVLVGDGKLAGILAEVAKSTTRNTTRSTIVVGIGLNVTLRPEEIGQPDAVSLVDLGVDEPDRTVLAGQLLSDLGHRINQWRSLDPALKADYRAHSLTIGSLVRAVLPGHQEVTGTARSVDDEGRLHIDTAGDTATVSAADVVHVRRNP
jgi:BirA family transcriptional regulator, biotin operon repressor / biotin---[acetyl-CoA-carboxylase] ligase